MFSSSSSVLLPSPPPFLQHKAPHSPAASQTACACALPHACPRGPFPFPPTLSPYPSLPSGLMLPSGLKEMAAFFEARAMGGVGLIVTGAARQGRPWPAPAPSRPASALTSPHTWVSPRPGGIGPNRSGRVSPFASKLTYKWEAKRHRVVTDAVHRHDGKICMQILHSGRYDGAPLFFSFFFVSPPGASLPAPWSPPPEQPATTNTAPAPLPAAPQLRVPPLCRRTLGDSVAHLVVQAPGPLRPWRGEDHRRLLAVGHREGGLFCARLRCAVRLARAW